MNTHKRNPSLVFILVHLLLASLLSGCEGGMVGSGTGPKNNPQLNNLQLRHLPSRIGPRLPKSLTHGRQPNSSNKRQRNLAHSGSRSLSADSSQNWRTLSPAFTTLDAQRLITQSELIVLDSIFENISTRCSDMQVDCEVLSENLAATLNSEVMDNLTNLQQSGFSSESIAQAGLDLEALRGTQLALGRVQYSRGHSTKYGHRLVVSPLALWPTHSLIIDWKDDHTTVSYQLSELDGGSNGEVFFVYSDRGQQLNYRNSTVALPTENNLAMKILGGSADDGYIHFDVQLDEMSITGRASDEQGYGYSVGDFYSTTEITLTAEHFSPTGSVLGENQCVIFAGSTVDCFSQLEQSASDIFMNTTLLPTETDLGLSNVTVSNVPANIQMFDIRSGMLGQPFEEQTIYCDGWNSPFAEEEAEIFCFEDISHLVRASVVSRDDFGNLYLLPDAKVHVNGRELGSL